MLTIASPNHYPGRIKPVRLIVIHTMEVDETDPNVAEAVARTFANPARQASAHVCVDTDSDVRCVADEDTAWAAPGANADGLQIELAGRAGQTSSDWQDPASRAILARAVAVCAAWATKYAIPLRHLSVAETAGGAVKGFIGHVDASQAFHQSDHWDPGQNFPWDQFLTLVAAAAGTQPVANTVPPVVKPTSPTLRNIAALQRAVRATPDNVWGPDTNARIDAVRRASVWGGSSFPYGAKFTQQVVGTTVDGLWGPASRAAHDATVRAIQAAVGVTQDAIWGPITDAAVRAAHDASHHTV